MTNLSISILNVDNLSEFLENVKAIQKELSKSKVENILDISIHFDVMDNKFVPNKGVDIEKIKLVKEYGFYIDTHLMVEKPVEDKYIDRAIEYGCKDITIHYEIDNFDSAFNYLLKKKKENNLKIGVSLKPNTDIKVLEKYIKNIDKILVMSVEPGFGGQKYIESATTKIQEIKEKYKNVLIQVDGGINDNIFNLPIRAGVNSLVVGSFLTKSKENLKDKIAILNIIENIEKMPKEANLDFEARTLQVVDGGYAKGDILLGIKIPRLRKLAKMWYNIISLDTLSFFISSDIHDYRRFAIFSLVNMANSDNKNEIKNFIDENINHINNWDLVDSCAPICIGKLNLNESDKKVYNMLRKYTKSANIWIKRIGIVSLLYFAKSNRKELVMKVLEDVFYDEYHLIQKANGWVLRELYKANPKDTLKYLIEKNNYKKLPNILKSYATEKMCIEEKNMLK